MDFRPSAQPRAAGNREEIDAREENGGFDEEEAIALAIQRSKEEARAHEKYSHEYAMARYASQERAAQAGARDQRSSADARKATAPPIRSEFHARPELDQSSSCTPAKPLTDRRARSSPREHAVPPSRSVGAANPYTGHARTSPAVHSRREAYDRPRYISVQRDPRPGIDKGEHRDALNLETDLATSMSRMHVESAAASSSSTDDRSLPRDERENRDVGVSSLEMSQNVRSLIISLCSKGIRCAEEHNVVGVDALVASFFDKSLALGDLFVFLFDKENRLLHGVYRASGPSFDVNSGRLRLVALPSVYSRYFIVERVLCGGPLRRDMWDYVLGDEEYLGESCLGETQTQMLLDIFVQVESEEESQWHSAKDMHSAHYGGPAVLSHAKAAGENADRRPSAASPWKANSRQPSPANLHAASRSGRKAKEKNRAAELTPSTYAGAIGVGDEVAPQRRDAAARSSAREKHPAPASPAPRAAGGHVVAVIDGLSVMGTLGKAKTSRERVWMVHGLEAATEWFRSRGIETVAVVPKHKVFGASPAKLCDDPARLQAIPGISLTPPSVHDDFFVVQCALSARENGDIPLIVSNDYYRDVGIKNVTSATFSSDADLRDFIRSRLITFSFMCYSNNEIFVPDPSSELLKLAIQGTDTESAKK